jgi:hypothetical protein
MSHDVFISYSTRDLDRMLDIYTDLRMQGLSVWIDKQGIAIGASSWRDAIEQGIKNARCVVVLFSPHSAISPWVKEELACAQDHERQIFPLLLYGESKEAVPLGFKLSQWVDLRTTDDMLRLQLFPRLAQHLGKPLPDASQVPSARVVRQETDLIREVERATRAAREAAERQQKAQSSAAFLELRAESDRKAAELEAIRQKAAEAELTQKERQRIADLERQVEEAQARLSSMTPSAEDEATARVQRERLSQLEAENVRLRGAAQPPKQAKESAKVQRLPAQPAPSVSAPEPQRRNTQAAPPKAASSALAPAVPHLNAWNPLDWLRLLRWAFFDSDKIRQYDQNYGKDARRLTGSWLASVLIWLPLLIPALALAAGAIPHQDVSVSPWLWIIVILGLLATVWVVQRDFVNWIYVVAFVMLVGAVGVMLSVGVGVGPMGFEVVIMAVGVSGVVAGVGADVSANLLTSNSRFVRIFLVLLLVTAYVVLIWFYWLGGWRVLGGGANDLHLTISQN